MKAASVFSDHMILLRDKDVCVFGTGEDGEEVTVKIEDMSSSVRVKDGKWEVILPSHPAGGPYEMTITGKEDKITFTDVMYGEVWIAGGQSNMELEIQNADFGEDELGSADYSEIRYYNVVKTSFIDDEILKEEEKRTWHMCRNGDFRDMSAIAYHFAKKVYEEIKVPVGIIDCYQGGTSISCWLSEENLASLPEGEIYISEYEEAVKGKTDEDYERELEEYNNRLDAYNKRVEDCKKEKPDITMQELNEKAGEYPWPPPMGRKSLYRPCGLYDAMVKRVCPYSVRGILYYQGEEDAPKTDRYDRLLMQLIEQYRTDWREPFLPFVIMQLPMFIGKDAEDDYTWPKIRKAQERVWKRVLGTSMAVIIDTGEYDNIHPTDKKTPGTRLALNVLENIYHMPVGGNAMFISFIQPVKDSGELILHFSGTYGEIKTGENILLDIRKAAFGEMPVGFELSDDGALYYPAKARIENGHIVVWSEKTVRPAYVSYGYFDYGRVNVYNGAGIPLAPFCRKVFR